MSKQPEALQLADELENGHYFESQPQVVYGWVTEDPTSDAAAELRRLHALCQEMGEVLEGLLAIRSDSQGVVGYHLNGDIAGWDYFDEVSTAEAALAKWKESK